MGSDIIKNIFKKSSIGTIIFFILNASIILGIFVAAGFEYLLIIFGIYVLSIIIAFSSFGEWMLCLMVGARKMTRVDMKIRMIPLLEIVYNKAKRKTPNLTNKIVLKVIYTPEPNAYAIGRRTVCVTEGLFSLPDDVIQGILAHEVAHLAYRHNEVQLLIGGGNFIITFLILIIKLISAIIAVFSVISGFRRRSFGIVVAGLFFAGIIWLWTKFCMLFLMWSSRENEYDADKYAAELGYGFELAKGLDAIGTSEPQESLLKALYSTHPNTHDRIGRLQQMGVSYYRY
ncbi:MAG: M48 family metalloprotease [Defluviitaleaceae bacterium]|nr:M48 family metalloprotease [Defluviitaleaceae bacterium]